MENVADRVSKIKNHGGTHLDPRLSWEENQLSLQTRRGDMKVNGVIFSQH